MARFGSLWSPSETFLCSCLCSRFSLFAEEVGFGRKLGAATPWKSTELCSKRRPKTVDFSTYCLPFPPTQPLAGWVQRAPRVLGFGFSQDVDVGVGSGSFQGIVQEFFVGTCGSPS
jgi:hypothetical protein